jgi:hypothetical protein
MSGQRPRHPRPGLAIGIALLLAWLGAVGISLVTVGSPDAQSRFARSASAAERPFATHGRVAPANVPVRADRGATR